MRRIRLYFSRVIAVLAASAVGCGPADLESGSADSPILVPSKSYPAWGDNFDRLIEAAPHYEGDLLDPSRLQLWTVKPAVFANLPSNGDQPIFILPFGHHYAGGGGIYTDTAVLESMATEIGARGLPFTFFTDGIATEHALADDPSFFTHINALGFDLGYHGEQDHGPEPRIIPALEAPPQYQTGLTAGLSWDAAIDAVAERYSRGVSSVLKDTGQGLSRLDPMLQGGTTDRQRAGGLALVESLYRRPVSIITTHSFEVAAAAPAFDSMSSYQVCQATGPLSGKYWPINLGHPEWVEAASTIGGDGPFFWYMGKLQEKTFDTKGYTYLSHSDPIGQLAALDRTVPQYVVYAVGSQMNDPTDFSAYYSGLDELVSGLASLAPARVIGASELPDIFEPQGSDPTFSKADLGAIAEHLVSQWSERPPAYVVVDTDFFTLVDALAGLVGALHSFGTTGTLPDWVPTVSRYGPIGPILAPASQPFEVSTPDIVAVATSLATVERDTQRWPTSVTLATGETINIAEVLHLMASAYLDLSDR